MSRIDRASFIVAPKHFKGAIPSDGLRKFDANAFERGGIGLLGDFEALVPIVVHRLDVKIARVLQRRNRVVQV